MNLVLRDFMDNSNEYDIHMSSKFYEECAYNLDLDLLYHQIALIASSVS